MVIKIFSGLLSRVMEGKELRKNRKVHPIAPSPDWRPPDISLTGKLHNVKVK